MDVHTLVFDLYGTLVDVRSLEAACSQETADPAAFLGVWRQKQLEYSWLHALMGRYEDFWAVTAAALDYTAERCAPDLDDAARARLLRAWGAVRPYPEVPAALDQLKPRRLAVLSNGSPRMLEEVLKASGPRSRFAHVLSVDEVGTYKPAPAVYGLAEARLGVPRDQILFVSSNGWDAAGASAYGLRAAWVNRLGAPLERLGVRPALVVRDLDELARRLAGAL